MAGESVSLSADGLTLEGITINYYIGDISIEVKGDFGTISYNCYYHGYMGGQNRLKWVNT